jgi:hypothetical protein
MQYRRKDAVVEAIQFDRKQFPWPEGIVPSSIGLSMEMSHVGKVVGRLGMMPVTTGDWVLKLPDGTRDVLTDEEFKATYEPVK